ncbi:MAG: UbiA family prenyltransferase [Methanocellales archaeon]|nr:UbiA family prenyltransferase [Methanocellales archaeon]
MSLLIAAFALTFAIYNFDRTIKQKEDLINDPERTRLFAGNRKIWIIIGTFSFIASMALALREGLNIFLTMFSIISVYVGYGIGFPLIPRLKDIPGVKNLVLVSSWTIVPTILPNLSESGVLEKKGILLSIMIFYFIFIKILVNSILYDVRDIKGDSATGVRTLPVVLGVKNVRMILLIFNSTLILWIMVCWRLNIFLSFLPILTANIFYGFWYINFFTENINNKRTLLDILVDGEWIPLTLLIALINILGWSL